MYRVRKHPRKLRAEWQYDRLQKDMYHVSICLKVTMYLAGKPSTRKTILKWEVPTVFNEREHRVGNGGHARAEQQRAFGTCREQRKINEE